MKYGDWKKFERVLARFETNLKSNCTVALTRAGIEMEGLIKGRILSGKGMAPLHPLTIALKGSSKPLIDDADLLNSVGCRYVTSDTVFVGVHRKAADGTDIAALHEREKGTQVRVTPRMRAFLHSKGLHLKASTQALFIPGRPFVKPAYKDFEGKGIAKKLFGQAIENTLIG